MIVLIILKPLEIRNIFDTRVLDKKKCDVLTMYLKIT